MSDSKLINTLTGAGRLDDSRRRAFVQTCVGFAVALVAYGGVMAALLGGFPLGSWLILFGAVSFLLLAFAAHRLQTVAVPAILFVAISIISILASAIISGGVDDFTAPAFIAIPILGSYFLGARGGIAAGIATIAAVAVLAVADVAGLIVDTPYPKDVFEIATAVVLATAIALTMMTAHLFTSRAAEHAASIEQSNALLVAFARTAPIAVAMFDRDIRYIEVSDRWLSDYGLKREDLIGRRLYDLVPDIAPKWKEVHARCLAGATERSEAEKFVRKDGSEQWLHWEVRPWRDPKGKIGGVIALTRDITQQVRAQEMLKAAKRQALEASNAKSAFLAAMSHEIRTPLNAVIGLTEAALDTELDARQRRLLEEANSAGAHLLSLISDVLDLSKLEAGKMALDAAPFSLADLVSGVAAMFAIAAESKGVVLETTVAPNARRIVTADENRLRQILVNIVGNALKFTAAGRIDIRARCSQGDSQAEGDLCIEVADTGIGIEPERLPTLFEAFAQADATIARRFGGTGLGLAICRKLLDEMGGEISCESAPGAGSTFRVRLPVRMEPGAALSGERRPAVDGALEGLRILFIDDNAGNRLVYEEMAKKLGCEARLAASGGEGLAACKEERFDAVVMDIEMADMDGIETAKAIRALTGTARDMPIIAATAHALKGDRERFIAAGMSDYLAKPVSRRALVDAVLRASGRGAPPANGAAPGESALLDASTLGDLAGVLSGERSETLFTELWDSLAGIIAALEQAGPDADPAQVRKLAHDACGLASSLGAAALSKALRRIEEATRDGAVSADLFDGIGSLSVNTRNAAQAFVERGAAG